MFCNILYSEDACSDTGVRHVFWYWSRLDSTFGTQEIRCFHASFYSIHSMLNLYIHTYNLGLYCCICTIVHWTVWVGCLKRSNLHVHPKYVLPNFVPWCICRATSFKVKACAKFLLNATASINVYWKQSNCISLTHAGAGWEYCWNTRPDLAQ